MLLPEGVERVRAKGRTYYYWNPGRGTKRQRERVRLPDPCIQPEAFAREAFAAAPPLPPPPMTSTVLLLEYQLVGTEYVDDAVVRKTT